MIGGFYTKRLWQEVCRLTCFLHFGWVLIAFMTLLSGYLVCDFSLLNVFLNDHTQMPWIYRCCALWGNHDGSMLLWTTVLAGMGAAYLFSSPYGQGEATASRFSCLTLGIQGGISGLFLLFLGMWCAPFDLILMPPLEGLGLNPLLQDRSLVIHPPLLYLGYGGFSLPFSMAFAAVILGEKSWSQRVHPWTLFAWSFLTLGIGWGSWWAYYELGWGGWWFWDPVENASLMPWLTGLALLHTLKVTQKNGVFNQWSLFLALLTFSLCMLGTFLVRAGILSSIHSFAHDAEKGFILSLIVTCTSGMAFAFWGLRLWSSRRSPNIPFISRSGGLFMQSIFFVGAAGIVALGTLAPLVNPKISVSPSYFNGVLIPFLVTPLALMPLIPFLPWRKGGLSQALSDLAVAGTFSLGGLWSVWILWDYPSFTAGLGIFLALWMAGGTLSLLKKPKKSYGMILAHLGFAICLLGFAGGSYWRVDTEKIVKIGDSLAIGPYVLQLTAVTLGEGPNFTASRAILKVQKKGEFVTILTPERRLYRPQDVLLSETAIYTTGFSDLYLVLGTYFEGDRWQLKGTYHPLVPWIWLGVICMFVGGMIAFSQRVFLPARSSFNGKDPGGHA